MICVHWHFTDRRSVESQCWEVWMILHSLARGEEENVLYHVALEYDMSR